MSAIPKSRDHLIKLINDKFDKLQSIIENLDDIDGEVQVDDDFSIKDIIVIRLWWSNSVIEWINEGKKHNSLDLPAKGYSWKDTPKLNMNIAKSFSSISLSEANKKLITTKKNLIELIDDLSDQELTQIGVYEWAGKWPLMRWISMSSSSQYDGASRLIRKAIKIRRKNVL